VALVVLALGLLARSRTGDGRAKVPTPWFVLGFVALIPSTACSPSRQPSSRRLAS